MINAETIQANFNLFKSRITAPSGAEEEILITEEDLPVITVNEQPSRPTGEQQTTTQPVPSVSPPAEQRPQSETPASQTQTQAPVQVRDRTVYFTHVGGDGQILQSRAVRRIPVSETPMLDALNAVLAGPTAEEISRGILNLIPQNTRVMSAAVRGSTAYINFSEDFLFNTFGVEGYVAQLRQIVWTATEFQNINDVQIQIEGRVIDYLGEGIFIGAPISRQSF